MWEEVKAEVTAIVPIMRLRRRKRTVGVSQEFMDAQIERREIASSNMAPVSGERERGEGEGESIGGGRDEEMGGGVVKGGRREKWSLEIGRAHV